MRKHWSSVRHASSLASADRNDEMLCVATIGIRRAWRDRAKARSSPVGSVSPTVAKAWYSSATKSRSRHGRCGSAAIFGMRCRTARWKSSFSMTPRPRARAGFIATGKVQAEHVPGLEQIFERRQRPRLARFRRVDVRLPWRAERAVDGGVFVEERQEHDDALDDGRFDLRIQPRPGVVEPPLNGLEPVPAVRANRGSPGADLEGNAVRARYASSSAS